MKQFESWVSHDDTHRTTNCLGLVFICQNIDQGWILDKNENQAFTIEQLASRLNGVKSLNGKPKFIIIQQSGESKLAINKVRKRNSDTKLTFLTVELFYIRENLITISGNILIHSTIFLIP